MSTYPTACDECGREFEEKQVAEKRYDVFERTVIGVAAILVFGFVASVLLGVYALADLVL